MTRNVTTLTLTKSMINTIKGGFTKSNHSLGAAATAPGGGSGANRSTATSQARTQTHRKSSTNCQTRNNSNHL